jgi:DNA-binding protein H-NS
MILAFFTVFALGAFFVFYQISEAQTQEKKKKAQISEAVSAYKTWKQVDKKPEINLRQLLAVPTESFVQIERSADYG